MKEQNEEVEDRAASRRYILTIDCVRPRNAGCWGRTCFGEDTQSLVNNSDLKN